MPRSKRSSLYTTAEAAEVLRLKPHTLENMRSYGTGPEYRKHGGRIFYHRRDLKHWSESSRRRSSGLET